VIQLSQEKSTGRLLFAVITACLATFSTAWFISNHGFSSADIIKLEYETDRDTLVSLHLRNRIIGTRDYTPDNSITQPIYAGALRTVTFQSKNKRLKNAMLEIHSASRVSIHSLSIYNAISKQWKVYKQDKLSEIFLLSNHNRGFPARLNNSTIYIETNDTGSIILIDPEFNSHNQLLFYGISIVIFLITFLFSSRFNPASIPAIQDLMAKDRGISGYRQELDGLRGIAALLVVMDHTWWRFTGAGATGVWLFFALSGYLLSQPFINRPDRALDAGYVVNYIFRRLARIIPMYVVTLLLFFNLSTHSHLFFSHLLFIQAEGHLWTIPQEVFFYLLLPFLMVLIFYLNRLPTFVFSVLLTVLTLSLLWNPEIIPVRLYVFSLHTAPYLGWFMVGMLVAYINPGGETWQLRLNDNQRNILSLLGIGTAVVIFGLSSPWITKAFFQIDWHLPKKFAAEYAVACGFLMLLILATPGTLLSRLFSIAPLRAIGIVGYSYYLIHPLIMKILMELSLEYFNYQLLHARLFLATAIISWLVSLFTYSLIERPFLLKRHQS